MPPRKWGWWTEQKLDVLGDYLAAFTTASTSAGATIYLHLFAGQDQNVSRSRDERRGGIAAHISVSIGRSIPSSRGSTVGTRHAQRGESGRPLYQTSVTSALAAFAVRVTALDAVIAYRCTSTPVITGPWISASGRVPVLSECSRSTRQPASTAARAQYSVCRLCSSLIGAGSLWLRHSPFS